MRVLAALGAAAVASCALRCQAPSPVTPPAYGNELRVADPLPWIKATLRSKQLRRLFRCGAVGDALAMFAVPDDYGPVNAWLLLQSFRDYVPEEVALQFPPETPARLGSMLRIVVALRLLECLPELQRTPEEQVDALRRELEGTIATLLGDLARTRIAVQLRCRKARTARQWYDELADGIVAACEGSTTSTLTQTEDSLQVRLEIDEPWRHDFLAGMAEQIAFLDEAALTRIAAAATTPTVLFEVAVDDADLSFHLHPDAPLPKTRTGAVATAPALAGAPVAEFRIDFGALVGELRATADLWRRFADHELGEVARSYDVGGVFGDLAPLAAATAELRAIAGRIAWDTDGARYAARRDATDSVRVGASPIWDLIPPSTAAYSVSGTTALPDLLYAVMLRVEDAFENAAGVAEDELDLADQERALRRYYERAEALRATLRDEGDDVLEAPHLALIGTTPFASDASGLAEPSAGLVLAGRLRRGADGLAYASQLLQNLLTAATDNTHPFRVGEQDLGLGTTTVALTSPKLARTDSEPAVAHAFVVDDFLVFSTSRQLSLAVLRERERGWLQTGGAETVARAGANGKRVAVFLGTLAGRISPMMVATDEASHDIAYSARLGVTILAELASLVDTVETETTVEHGAFVDRAALRVQTADREAEVRALVERAQQAIGPWPHRGNALRASGTSNYLGLDSTFFFTCGQDGHYHNLIKSLAVEENVYTDKAWMRHRSKQPMSVGDAERDFLIGFDAICSGQWAWCPAGMELSMATDGLPGTEPALLLTFPTSDQAMRIRLDAATGLPRSFRPKARSLTSLDTYQLSDYREVMGRRLPYRIESDDTFFNVRSWKKSTLRAGKPRRPAAPRDTSFAGPSLAEFRAQVGGVVRVRAGGKQAWLNFHPGRDTSISRHVLREMGCSVSDDDEWTTVKRLKIGPMTIRDLVVYVAPDPNEEADDDDATTVNGYIGLDITLRACVAWDYRNERLELMPPGSFDDHEAPFAPVVTAFRQPAVELKLDGRTTVKAMLHFVPSGTFLVLNNSARLLDYRVPRDRMAPLSAAYTGRVGTLLTNPKLGRTWLGPATCLLPMARLPELSLPAPEAILGLSLLEEEYDLLLDLPNARAAFVAR